MKKIVVSVLIFSISLISFAQLNIKSTSNKSDQIYKDTWATVTWNGSAFMLNSSDPVTALTLSITLGPDKAHALTTLNQIKEWFYSVETKSAITFEDDGREITLYKTASIEMVISNGDAEYIRKETSRRISGALLGTSQYAKKEATPHYSFIKERALLSMIENISALSDPKYLGDNPEDDPAYQQAQAEKKKKAEAEVKLVEIQSQIDLVNTRIDEAKAINNKELEKELKQQLKALKNSYREIDSFLYPEKYNYK